MVYGYMKESNVIQMEKSRGLRPWLVGWLGVAWPRAWRPPALGGPRRVRAPLPPKTRG
jgi:hypothetical protein